MDSSKQAILTLLANTMYVRSNPSQSHLECYRSAGLTLLTLGSSLTKRNMYQRVMGEPLSISKFIKNPFSKAIEKHELQNVLTQMLDEGLLTTELYDIKTIRYRISEKGAQAIGDTALLTAMHTSAEIEASSRENPTLSMTDVEAVIGAYFGKGSRITSDLLAALSEKGRG